jgi:signal transduction histidine kinase
MSRQLIRSVGSNDPTILRRSRPARPPVPPRSAAKIGVGVAVAFPASMPGWGPCLVTLVVLSGTATLFCGPADAADSLAVNLIPSLAGGGPHNAFGLAVLLGLVIFSTTLSILHMRERGRWAEEERRLRGELDSLHGARERADVLLASERQVILSWEGRNGEPRFEGDPSLAGEGATARDVLSFESWISPAGLTELEAALAPLRARGEGFLLTLPTAAGGYIEAEGRTMGGSAVLRLTDVTGERAGLIRAEASLAATSRDMTALRAFLDALDEPVWLRGENGRLAWANRAYCAAVEASGPEDACARSLELLDRADRDEAARRRAAGERFGARVAAIVTGSRRVLNITEMPTPGGSGGIAQDVSELDAVQTELHREMQAHARTLDQLPTAVAMFDAKQRLVFYNAAYRELWKLDDGFLATYPSDGEILDKLRAARLLPEQADYRVWKTGVLEAYRAVEPGETWWHLPDRRTLRVVTNPNPQGGLTYLFEDVSERVGLESRFNQLLRVQTETLDTLAEGVALFRADGRLQLFNRAFATLWQLDRDALLLEPHIESIAALCHPLAPDEDTWAHLRAAVAGLTDIRLRMVRRVERRDGAVLDCVAEPLPDGATLLTFIDVTASVNVERALTDRNDALERAARLRNEFVHHVSYELRSPLTNIIGFTELLGDGTVGPLNDRQRDYAGHIMRSSGALLAILNDILDLASIDTDAMEIVRDEVDIRDTIEAAAKGVQDRLVEASLTLEIDVPPQIGTFVADAKRVRQILFNLLSNAAGFSSPGQTVTVRARKENGEVVLSVVDRGQGVPDAVRARIFDRFESHTRGTRHRGVGLGLSIVRSFVELHGGRVELDSTPGEGTVVTCRFPADGQPLDVAA